MISLQNVHKSFADQVLLKDISFTIKPGERVSLLGPGSSGKSTILKMILGLVPCDSGNISLFDQDHRQISGSDLRQLLRKVGMAFQQGGLFDFMNVYDNVAFAMEHMTKANSKQISEKITQVLAGVKLTGAEKKFPFELSGGMQKRVGIARALSTSPELAIFDEPTAGLDPVTSTIILNMIVALGAAEEKRSLLIATSNVEIAIRFAERIVVINEGAVVGDGSWREMMLHGDEWLRNFLGIRLIGLDYEYAKGLNLPEEFIKQHWTEAQNSVS